MSFCTGLHNSKGDAQSYYNCFACFLWKSSGLCFISCEGYYRVVMWMGFCKEEFPGSVSKLEGLSKTTWRPFWRYDWQRQQLDWLKGQRSELYFRMFIVKFSYHYDYERNKMYRLSPTVFFKTWTWRRFTTRFTRERGRVTRWHRTEARGWLRQHDGHVEGTDWQFVLKVILLIDYLVKNEDTNEMIPWADIWGSWFHLIIWQEIIFLPAIHLISI